LTLNCLFNTSFVFTQELEWHFFGFIFLIGAGYTLLHDGHVRVDIIYQHLGFKGQAWINLYYSMNYPLKGKLFQAQLGTIPPAGALSPAGDFLLF
jgi:TRAP-type mannitol/chloroaromatic compound transport system permease small subunit